MHSWSRAARIRAGLLRGSIRACAIAVTALPLVLVGAGALAEEPEDLTALDIEDLFDLEVTSLSKKSQRFTEAPAAVFVLSGDDIRRSGMRSIPEALRLVPGVQVSRLSANRWAISARGFASVFSDKLLVLIDGRSVYTPLFAGVYWDTVDTLIEDIDRIEVIRGPGGTLWGANAVNGVINIVTKNAKETEGVMVSGGGGNVDRFVGGRAGVGVNEDLSFRAYAKYYNNTDFKGTGAVPAHDKTDQGRGGLRLDWTPTENDSFTLDGGVYRGDSDGTVDEDFGLLPDGFVETDTEVKGAHALARYTHSFSESNEAAFQVYYDRTERDDAMWEERRDTVDLDLQQRFSIPLSSAFSSGVVWGAGYRYTDDHVDPGIAGFDPDSRDTNLYTAFLQSELGFFEERLRITAGSKVEHNDHTGWEFQPSVRVAYIPTEKQTLWASFTRAVRTPARSNDDLQINNVGPIPTPDGIRGNNDSVTEKVLAYELGYRVQPFESVSFDVAGFFNEYKDLQTLEVNSLVAPTDIEFDNKMHGESWGVEAYLSWRPVEWWKLAAWYAYIDLDLDLDNGSLAQPLIPLGSEQVENGAPKHTVQLRSSMDLPYDTELDVAFWWVDDIEALNIDAYERLDVRVAWKPLGTLSSLFGKSLEKVGYLELAVVGQNLTDGGHKEWETEFGYQATRIPRTVYGMLTWRH